MNRHFLASWWIPDEKGMVLCQLCPRHCRVPDGATGYCGVRRNQGGVLCSLAYGRPVSIAIDPIEKKPLARFLPGTKTFSIGTYGCNLGCSFCQNHTLSRGEYREEELETIVSPEQIVIMALEHRCPSISYTYNEPTVFAEYLRDIARIARQAGLKNILVSNGFIDPTAADELYPLVDAANIDMKGFSEAFYEKLCQASLAPVLVSLEKLHRLGVHLEITTLVIPGQNDQPAELAKWLDWVEAHLGCDAPLHFSAYHPAFHCKIPRTPASTLFAIRDLAAGRGFSNVFLGNIF
ncbi:MAG: AmmeMemoRadiSam system radical SAM enzyme [Victivallales bacterium]|nr:AmmeMemoRadiSam system radical SAM enzyme [Victivallales bacterium]